MSSTELRKEIKTDLSLLLDCLKFQTDDEDAQKQALTAISNMFSYSDVAKDIFRSSGGLKFVYSLIMKRKMATGCRQEVLFTLACSVENCKANQKALCCPDLFVYLYELIEDEETDMKCRCTAMFLIGSLVAQNGDAQVMLREKKLLISIVTLVKSVAPLVVDMNDAVRRPSVFLWESLMTALKASVDNPLNVENQCVTTQVFPATMLVIKKSKDSLVLRTTAAFISASTSGNHMNKDRARLVDSIPVIVTALQSQLPLEDDSVVALLSALCSLISENEANQKCLADCGAVPFLVGLLREEAHRDRFYLLAALALGSCIDSSAECRESFIGSGGLPDVVKLMASSQSEEIKKACTFILQVSYRESASKTALKRKRQCQEMEDVVSQFAEPHCPCKSLSDSTADSFHSCDSVAFIQPTSLEQTESWKRRAPASFIPPLLPPPPVFATPMRSTYNHSASSHWSRSTFAPQFYTPQRHARYLSTPQPFPTGLSHFYQPFLTPSQSSRSSLRRLPSGRYWTPVVPAVPQSMCPACLSHVDGVLLNSRTFLAAVRSSAASCSVHVRMVGEHRLVVGQLKAGQHEDVQMESLPCESPVKDEVSREKSLYELSSSEEERDDQDDQISTGGFKKPFSEKELEFLQDGVKSYGQKWSVIHKAYNFDRCRTPTELKDKYRCMKRNGLVSPESDPGAGKQRKKRVSFTKKEVQYLRLGVRVYGHHWQEILTNFDFNPCRVGRDLKEKWRNLTQKDID